MLGDYYSMGLDSTVELINEGSFPHLHTLIIDDRSVPFLSLTPPLRLHGRELYDP